MLAPAPPSRPSAAAFASCQWLQEDVALRALRFLDTMLQREAGQKARGGGRRGCRRAGWARPAAGSRRRAARPCASTRGSAAGRPARARRAAGPRPSSAPPPPPPGAPPPPAAQIAFIKDLSTMWTQFDDRLLRHKVLPPIVGELRGGGVTQLAALPLVLQIMGRMSPEDFEAAGILPVLRPAFEAADGELLLALVRNAGVFQRLMKGCAARAGGARGRRALVARAAPGP